MPKLLRVPVQGLVKGPFELPAEAVHYVTRVHRLAKGASLLLFEPERGVEAEALIERIGREAVSCSVAEVRACRRMPHKIVLFQGLAKGDKLDQVVAEATALGLGALSPVITERSVVQLNDSKRIERRIERWRRVAIAAARQSGRGELPELRRPQTLMELLQPPAPGAHFLLDPGPDATPLLSALQETQLELASGEPPQSDQPQQTNELQQSSEAPQQSSEARQTDEPQRKNEPLPSNLPQVNLWIGPEGGFTALETEQLRQVGAKSVSLGALVLRTELAAISAIAVCGAYLEQLSFTAARLTSE